MIVGDEIKDNYGNRAGILNGSEIKNNSGNRVGMIVGTDIKDNYGNKMGSPVENASNKEMAAAALLLFNLSAGNAGSNNSSNSGEEPGLLGRIFEIIISLFRFIFKTWGGRIGVISAVVLLIMSFIFSDGVPLSNAILLIVLLGLVGSGIGGIVGFIRKLVRKNKPY